MEHIKSIQQINNELKCDLTEKYLNKRYEVIKAFDNYTVGTFVDSELILYHYYIKFKNELPKGAFAIILSQTIFLIPSFLFSFHDAIVTGQLLLLLITLTVFKAIYKKNTKEACLLKVIDEVENLIKEGNIKATYC